MSTIYRISRSGNSVSVQYWHSVGGQWVEHVALRPHDLIHTEDGFKPAPQATDEEIVAALKGQAQLVMPAMRPPALYRVERQGDEVRIQRRRSPSDDWEVVSKLHKRDLLWKKDQAVPLEEAQDAEILSAVLASQKSLMTSSFLLAASLILLVLAITAAFSLLWPVPSQIFGVLVLSALVPIVLRAAHRRRLDGV